MAGISPVTPPNIPVSTQDGASLRVNMCAAINAMARLGFAFAPSAQTTPNMTVALAAGHIPPNLEVAAQSTGTIAAPTTHPRKDLVCIDNATGAVSVVTGTEAASPVVPALPSGKSRVAEVTLAVGQTSITAADVADVRGLGLLGLGSAALLSADSLAQLPHQQGIINGALQVWQRGTSFAGIAGGPTKTIILTATGGGNTWVVPADWNNANNTVICIGAGAGGAGSGNGSGGGGGAFAARSNLSLTPGGSINYIIGVGGGTDTAGGDTFFNASSMPSPGTTTNVGAKGGSPGSVSAGGLGGLAASSNGATVFPGGNGGMYLSNSAGGGGGAGGKNGAGANGSNGPTSIGGASGGDTGTGGNNGPGGAGSDYTATSGVTAGPGGGGGGNNGNSLGVGGLYGGGGGGGGLSGAAGAQGLIIIQYSPAAGATYTADAWFALSSGGSASVSRQAGTNGYPFALRMQRPAGNTATSVHKIGHIIEGVDCARFAGKSAVLSFTVKRGANFSATGNLLSVELYTGTAKDEGLLSLLANTWTGSAKKLDTTQAITTSDVQYSFPVTLDAGINEIGLMVGWTPTGTAGADDWFQIEGVALKLSGVADPCDFPQYDADLRNCQRRCVVAAAYVPAATAQNLRSLHMRAVPSIAGGGAGFTGTGTTKDALIGYQTAGAVQTLTLSADL